MMIDKKTKKGQETYHRIINATINIIVSDGISGISASKISSESKISKSTIFHHFKSIEDISLTILDIVFQKIEESMNNQNFDNLYDFLLELGNNTISFSKKYVKENICILSFYHEGIFNEKVQNKLRIYLEHFTNIIISKITLLNNNISNDEKIRDCTLLLLSSLDGLCLHSLLNKSNHYHTIWELQIKSIYQELIS